MILITRCPHCRTSFKVTDDQLRLYDGAVRCGVCQQVFNGADHLLEEGDGGGNDSDTISLQESALSSRHGNPPLLKEEVEGRDRETETEELPPLSLEPTDQGDAGDEMLLSLSEDAINAAAARREELFNRLEKELSEVTQAVKRPQGGEKPPIDPLLASIPSKRGSSSPSSDSVSIQDIVGLTESLLDRERVPFTPPVRGGEEMASGAPRLEQQKGNPPKDKVKPGKRPERKSGTNSTDSLADASSRVRELFRQNGGTNEGENGEIFLENWPGKNRQPAFMTRDRGRRKQGILWGVLSAFVMFALVAGVAVQLLYLFSDRLVAWMPSTGKMVAGICGELACPRHLEARISALTIESSELQRIPEFRNRYLLQLGIRNNARTRQIWPHIELTLTDAEKKPAVRRILMPVHYLSDANRMVDGVSPDAEETVKVYFEMKDLPITDYRVVLFYP